MKDFRKEMGVAKAAAVAVGFWMAGLVHGQGLPESSSAAARAIAASASNDGDPVSPVDVVALQKQWAERMREGPPYPSASDLKHQADEGHRLVLQLQGELQNGEVEKALETIHKMPGEFGGDRAALLEGFRGELRNPKWEIRAGLAREYLKMGICREASIATLREIVRDAAIPDVPDDESGGGGYSPRMVAATFLCRCGAKEAADDIWALYRESRSPRLALLMAEELGDERPRELVAKVTYRGAGYIENVRLLGHYQVAEAVEPLKKEIAAQDLPGAQIDFNRCEAEAALFQITGDVSRVQWLIDHCNNQDDIARLARLKSPLVKDFLEKLLMSKQRGGFYPGVVFPALYQIDPKDPVVRKVVLNALEGRPMEYPVPLPLVFQVAVRLDDPEVQSKGALYAYNVQPNEWNQAYTQRNWPYDGSHFGVP